MEEETAVKVCLRVRPLIDIEESKKCSKVVQYPAPGEIALSADKGFTFDYVYDDSRKQKEIYEEAVSPIVKNFLRGYNTTILAYGQTGSGKTFTMGTAGKQEDVSASDIGIIPRVVTELFESIKQQSNFEYEVRVCFLEIHNEAIKDLLNPLSSENVRTLAIREGMSGEITVSGAEEIVVTSAEAMFRALEQGSHNRATAATNMNNTSSRSHAIFTITLAQTKKRKTMNSVSNESNESEKSLLSSPTSASSSPLFPPSPTPSDNSSKNDDNDEEDEEVLTSKFHFVDLAGSERLKRTGAVGARMQEGISINCGLLALANVISALADQKKGGHVPFRDSKITRLLQDSLGGNSQTLMIACISPADVNVEESLNTLRYANRARNIKNKPTINRNPHTQKILRLTARIAELEALLALQGANVPPSGLKSALNSTLISHTEYKLLQDQVSLYSAETCRLDGKLAETRSALAQSSDALQQSLHKVDELNLLLSKRPPSTLDSKDNATLTTLKQTRQDLSESTLCLSKARAELVVKQQLIDLFEQQYGKADSDMILRAEQKAQLLLSSSFSLSPSSSSSVSPPISAVEDESEAKRLSALTDLKNREYELKMGQLNRVVVNLDSGIKQKEHLVSELARERDNNQLVERTLSTKIEQVESDIRETTKKKEEQAAKSSDNVLIVKYSRKIEELNIQLRQFREKLKECASLKGQLDQDAKRIFVLQEEICASKQQRVKLQQQIHERRNAYNQWMKEKDFKLQAMAKQARKQQLCMEKLQSELGKQTSNVKRGNEKQAELCRELQAEKKNSKTMSMLLQQKRAGVSAPTVTSTIKRAIAVHTLPNPPKKPTPGAPKATTPATSTTTAATTTSSAVPNRSMPTKSVGPNVPPTRPKFGGMQPKGAGVPVAPMAKPSKNEPESDKENIETGNTDKSERRKSGRLALLDLNANLSPTHSTATPLKTLHGSNLRTPQPLASETSSTRKRRHSFDLRTPRPRQPRKQDASTVDISQSMQELEEDLVRRLNTASTKELTKMPMIGKKRVQLILANRDMTPFKTVSDLSCIGFSDKNISDFIKRNMIGKIWDGADINLLNISS